MRTSKPAFRPLLGLAALAALAACGPPSHPAAMPAPDSAPTAAAGPLVSSLQVAPQADGVHLVLQVTNAGAAPVALTFGTGQSYDFAVARAGTELWRWSADRSFTQAVRETSLAPGQTLRYEATWTPPAGTHGPLTARGWLTAGGTRAEQSAGFTLP